MRLRTPGSRWVLWAAGLFLGLAVIPLLIWSGRLYYAEGGQSPDAPGMLFASAIFLMPGWLSLWLLAAAPYLWRYRGGDPLVVGIGGTPLSLALSLLAFAISIGFVWLAVVRVEFWRFTRLPFVIHLLGCAIYWQYLRAAAVGRSLRFWPGR